MKNKFKRFLAVVLTAAMVLNVGPMSVIVNAVTDGIQAMAAEDTDYLFFATDRHTNTSIIATMINNMEGKIGENKLEYLGLGGDMVGSGNSHPAYNSSTVLAEATSATSSLSAANMDIVAGIHDMNVNDDAGIVLPYSGGGAQIYEGDKYYVYGVPESCISGAVNGVDPETEANDFVTWANGSDIDKSKVIIVLSHYPLHQRRNDNDGAVYWASALNTVAVGDDTTIDRDVVFFWGHNHTGETSADTAVYHVAPKSSISVQGGSSSQTIYFTYANAGYLNAKSSATLLSITDTAIKFEKYVSSSVSTTNTVTRVVTATPVTPSTLAVTGNTEYTVGDTLQDPSEIVVTYSDSSTKTLSAGDLTLTITTEDGVSVELTDGVFTAAGTYNLTYSYTESGQTASATLKVTVNEAAPTENTVTYLDNLITIQATALGLTEIEAENVWGEPNLSGTFSDYVAYDVTLTGHTDGNEVFYSMLLVDGMDTTNLALYYVAEDGTLTEIPFNLVTDQQGNQYVEFTTTYVGIFAYGALAVPEGYTLTGLEVTNIETTKYFVGDSLDMVNAVVTAIYTNTDGETYTATVFDAYDLTFDMNVVGKQTVIVSYTEGDVTVSDTFEIEIFQKVFPDEETGVSVEVDTYGATAITAAVSTNENVDAAVADVMKGGTYVAYDIELAGYNDGETVTVTLPIPEGVTNPVVYYVSDDGATVTNMNATKGEDGTTVSFETDHFSTYVVGESTEITVPDPITQTVTGATTSEKKTVYVLTSSISSGTSYLIVSANSAGSANALANNSGSVSATGVTIVTDNSIGTYIELDDAANELWTVGGSYTFKNGSYYLSTSGSSGNYSLSLTTSTPSKNWSWSSNNNRLSIVPGRRSNYYLYYNSGWGLSSSNNSVYFYVPTEIEVTVSANGTYSIAGNPAEVSKVVVEGTTTTLGSTLTFVPESGTTTTTDTSATATYKVVDGGDPNGIISSISGNTVTFTGNYGKALVKVSYTVTVNGTDYTVDNYITVTATAPVYEIEITETVTDDDGNRGSGEVINRIIAVKGVTSSTTYDLWAKVTYTDADGETEKVVSASDLEWESSDESIATVDEDGIVHFTGKSGQVNITVSYEYETGKSVTDTVTISCTTSQYSVPADGITDFPEYPNEGAIRFDKTATAVGNFSETGITQVELSMTGVPYTTNNAMDVVVMLDMTGSMSTNGMEAAEEATKAFVEKIVKNEDGTYNSNRIAVYAFNSGSSSPYELVSLKSITSDAELETANTAIDTASDKQASGGTPFDEAAEKCYDVLQAAKTDGIGNDRQQFCVFMSDGGPTSYAMDDGDDTHTTVTNSGSGTTAITSYLSGYSSSTSSSWSFTLGEEYWTNKMKADGVTIYTVGLLLQTAPSNPSPYSSMTDSTYDSTTDSLTSIGSHYYFTSAILKQMASDESKYIDIFSVDNADNATAKFTAIAQSILEAAKDVVVTDKIADDYTMVFDIPTGSKEIEGLDSQEFYIEFVQYALDENHERTTETGLQKLYLGVSNGTYYAASDANGTAYESPVFTAAEDGEKAYWSTVDSTYTAAAGEIVINVNGTYYKFIEGGNGDYNMTSGAYAYGTIDSTTNMSTDLVIVTPYFAYSAATKMLCWTVEKLTTVEYALRYFLYLDQSATEVGTDNEVPSGPYETNDYAYITYTNFNGNECRQEFPVPQMTWNGAQVSYVFYLVNAAGQPINKSGQVVDFANASFVTDVFTTSVVWNKDNTVGETELNVKFLADELLPDAYTIYDTNAEYTIHVYQDASGNSVFDYFIIDGSDSGLTSYTTTKVYNTKAGMKYADYGTYSAEAIGTVFTTTDADGNTVIITTTKQASLDYSDTTVAFAVLWEPALVDDTVVVDFGLDVLINVVQNDNLQNTVSGIGLSNEAYGVVEKNIGVSTTSKLGTAALTTSDGSTISIENENQVRFHQNDMTFETPVTFYYESPVEFYEGSNKQEGYMYSSVTVIPATTVYYEDNFLSYEGNWTTEKVTPTETQDQDRPGESQISAALDADNVYGYDSAYTSMSTYSGGSAMMATVSSGNSVQAAFTFCGTGFDVISLTDNTTGTIIVDVYAYVDGKVSEEKTKSLIVDTYYGYTYDAETKEWVLSANDPNALYQVPVMKVSGLTYGKYDVKITAAYASLFDHNDTGSYNFYLDAIRIYDPTGVASGSTTNETVSSAYVADGEGWPQYIELRNNIIAASNYSVTENEDGTVTVSGTISSGAIFIDSNDATTSISDYISYGPNNELYLAAGQSVAFNLDQTYASIIADVQIALKVGNGGSVYYEMYNAGTDGAKTNSMTGTLATATDLYYSIMDLASGTIVITNTGDSGILSITNIKVTYKVNPYGTSTSSDESEDEGNSSEDNTDETLGSGESVNSNSRTTSLYMNGASAASALMSLRTVSTDEPEVEETEAETTESETEETEAETTESETEETEAETTESETEETEAETTEAESKETEVETTEPEDDETENIADIIRDIIGKIRDTIGGLFGRWFN